MNILLIAATEAEIAPLTTFIAANWQRDAEGVYARAGIQLTIRITGVGMVATVYHLTKILTAGRYDLIIQAGIGGSFDRGIELGEVVLVNSDCFGDFGAEDNENRLSIFQLGLLDANKDPFVNGKLPLPDNQWRPLISLKQVSGVTVNTVTGSEKTVSDFNKIYPGHIESMEGAAFHYVCLLEGVAFMQIRAISNYVEPRDKSKWKMKESIANLNNWLIDFFENKEMS
ncbi:MAG: futalosine hydrolase [Bacteroidetes bacterium]|nr:futalosine hydrolase [Bacteroidota bacterium]